MIVGNVLSAFELGQVLVEAQANPSSLHQRAGSWRQAGPVPVLPVLVVDSPRDGVFVFFVKNCQPRFIR